MAKITKQQGFGLVELMIALMLSLVVVAGLYAAFIGDQKSYELTRASHLLVNKNRMSIQTMRLYLQQAGFRDYNQLYNNTLLPVADSLGFTWDEAQMLQGLENQTTYAGAKNGTDVVALRFYGAAAPNASLYACDGSEVAADSILTMAFFISPSNQLVCRDPSGDTVFDQDIDNLQLLYFSANGGNNFRYIKASMVGDWSQVNRLKLGLLVSQDVTMGSLSRNHRYPVLDEEITVNDKKLRQAVSETVMLLNRGAS